MVLYGKFSQPYSQYPVRARASGGAVYPLFKLLLNQSRTYQTCQDSSRGRDPNATTLSHVAAHSAVAAIQQEMLGKELCAFLHFSMHYTILYYTTGGLKHGFLTKNKIFLYTQAFSNVVWYVKS